MVFHLLTREPLDGLHKILYSRSLQKEQKHQVFYHMITFTNLFILMQLISRRDKLLSTDY
jgi:hypothetical protein